MNPAVTALRVELQEASALAALQRHALAIRTRLPGAFEAFDAWLAEVATARGQEARESAARAVPCGGAAMRGGPRCTPR